MRKRIHSLIRAFAALAVIAALMPQIPARAEAYFVWTGVLYDGAGTPAPGVTMSLRNADDSFYVSFATDEAGAFSVETVADAYALEIEYLDYNSGVLPRLSSVITPNIAISANMTQNLTIPTRHLTVNVLDDLGQPMPDATVSLSGDGMNTTPFALYGGSANVGDAMSWQSMRLTDSAGQAILPFLPASDVPVWVFPPEGSGLPAKQEIMTLTDDATVNIPFTVAYSWNGTLATDGAVPIPDFNLSITNPAATAYANAVSDANGAFSFSTAADTYDLSINGGDEHYGPTPSINQLNASGVTIADDMTLDLTVPIRTFSVTVNGPNGQPLPDSSVLAYTQGGTNVPFALYPGGNDVGGGLFWRARRVTDASGVANLPIIAAYGVKVIVTPPASSQLPMKTVFIDMAGDTAATIGMDQVVTWNGRLLDDNGIGLGGFQMSLANGIFESFASDANGYFSAHVPAGTYNLTVSGGEANSGYPPSIRSVITKNVTVTEGMTQNLVIPLRQTTITVLDNAGTPVVGATVSISAGSQTNDFALYQGAADVEKSIRWTGARITDANGQVVVPTLPAKKAVISVYPLPSTGLNSKTAIINTTNGGSTTIRYRRNQR